MRTKKLICFNFIMLLTSCSSEEYIPPSPITKHIEHDVAMSKGINFKTKSQIILNPFTGEVIKPCNPKGKRSKSYNDNDNDKNCTTELIEPKDPVIQYILDNAQSPIPVKVKRNGKVIDDQAVAIVSIDVIYKGSHCEASFSGGVKTVNCSNLDISICNAYLPYRGKTVSNATAQQIINYCELHFWK